MRRLPGGRGEDGPQVRPEFLTFGRPDHANQVPGVVYLAALVARPLEVAGDGCLKALVQFVGDHKLHVL